MSSIHTSTVFLQFLHFMTIDFASSIISYIDDIGLEPSIALGGIIQFIPVDIMDMVTKTMVADTNVRDANMTMALKRMIGWLSWPGAVNIDHWVVAFLHGLASVHKHAILVDVVESQVEQVRV